MLKILAVLCAVAMFSSISTAGIRHYVDEDGCPRFEYIRGYQNPDLIVSEEDYNILYENDKQHARERAIEKIGKAKGLSISEISALQEQSRKQFERDFWEGQERKEKSKAKSLDGIKPNSGKVGSAKWENE